MGTTMLQIKVTNALVHMVMEIDVSFDNGNGLLLFLICSSAMSPIGGNN